MHRIRGPKWLAIRARVLRDNPLCVDCAAIGRTTAADEVDHIVALRHGGTNAADNLQPLCKACHARKTILERGDTYRAGCDASGWPADPAHHWNGAKG